MASQANGNRSEPASQSESRSAASIVREVFIYVVGAAVLAIGIGMWNTRDIVTRLDERMRAVESDVCGIKGSQVDQGHVQTALNTYQNSIATLEAKVDTLKDETGQLIGIAGSEMPTMADIASLRERIAAVEARLEMQVLENVDDLKTSVTARK
jgi:hypothetical protein